jgi:acyl-CoA synthetase (AMP-forming)/AMP-acid ligase II
MRPYHLLIPSDNIAISDKQTSLTYNEFIKEIHAINEWYKSLGYRHGHRICVVGKNTVKTYLYLFAAALDMCATTLPPDGTRDEWQFRLSANNANAIIHVGETVNVEHIHYDKSTVLDKEIMLYYSSGTSHPYGWQKSYPVPYELDNNNWGTSQDVTHYYRDQGNPYYRNPETNRTINVMSPYIGWGQEVTFTTIARHGWVHLIDEPTEYSSAAQYVKPTWLAGFPLVWQRVMDTNNNGSHSIEIFEYSGAKLIDGQREKFEQFFGHNKWICGYGDAATGMTFVNYTNDFSHIGQPVKCLLDSGAEFRISDLGTIEFKGLHTPNNDWWDTGDIATINNDGNWVLHGRNNELIIIRGGGKVYPFEVEATMLTHECVEEIFVYPAPDHELHNIPNCVYYGDILPFDYAVWTSSKMAKWKQPIRYIQLIKPLSQLQSKEKVSRLKLHNLLQQHPEWIKNEYTR